MTKVIDTDYLPDCPCFNCICVPVCRHKDYRILRQDCLHLKLFLPDYHDFVANDWNSYDRLASLKLALQPTSWDMGIEGYVTPLGGIHG